MSKLISDIMNLMQSVYIYKNDLSVFTETNKEGVVGKISLTSEIELEGRVMDLKTYLLNQIAYKLSNKYPEVVFQVE